ncbi:MAG: DUF4870 domain-containing protein, partial [Bacteroidota bacterium]
MEANQPYIPQPTGDDKALAVICHLGFILPYGGILVPLIIWLIKRNESEYIDLHGKEALNFQLTVLILSVISGILVLLVVGLFLLIAIAIGAFIMSIIGAVQAGSG